MNDMVPDLNTSSENPDTPNQAPQDLPAHEQPSDAHTVNVSSATTISNLSNPEAPDYAGEPEVVNKEFTYPTHTDPQRARDPHGIYLDDVQRREAEIVRARIENREPDLDNPPAIQGTPLLPTGEVRKNLPGDHVVVADKELPVVVGVSDENLSGYGDAEVARKVKAEAEDK